MDALEKTQQRLTTVELSLMHLQNDYDKLNEVVIEQAHGIEKLRAELNRLSSQLKSAQGDSSSERIAEDEVPPHY